MFLEVLFPKGVINKDKVGGGDGWGEEGVTSCSQNKYLKSSYWGHDRCGRR